MMITGGICGPIAQQLIWEQNTAAMTPDVLLLPLCLVIYVTYMFLKTRKTAENKLISKNLY